MRYVILSDLHSGDSFGLVNPANVSKPYKPFAKPLFDWYVKQIETLSPVDGILCPGELTEGPGKKSTLEHWTTDMEEQAEAAAELLAMWDAQTYHLCYSSHYHSGDDMQTDNMVVDKLKLNHNKPASIASTQRIEIAGTKINMFHVVGGGSTPESFARALMKAVAVDVVRASYRDYEPADLYIRGHSHVYGEAKNNKWHAYNAPCLKWPLGIYGRRIDRPYYAMGLGVLDVTKDGYDLQTHIFDYQIGDEVYESIGRDDGKDKRGNARKGRGAT